MLNVLSEDYLKKEAAYAASETRETITQLGQSCTGAAYHRREDKSRIERFHRSLKSC
jgi:hypothetical protein